MSLDLSKVAKAVEEAKRLAKPRKFAQSVELIIKLRDVDMKRPENRINMEVVLPHPPPEKLAKVAVIATGDLALKAREAKADMVITREDLEKAAANKRLARKLAKSVDFFLAQPDLMPVVGRYLGKYLGPRGKMPRPVPPSADIAAMIERYRKCIRIRTRDQPLVMCRVGLETQSPEEIAENIGAVVEALKTKFKIPYNVERMYVKLTMGPAVEVEL